MLLWNHFYLWGPKFVEYENFAGLLVHVCYFVNNLSSLLHINVRPFVYEDVNSGVRETNKVYKL